MKGQILRLSARYADAGCAYPITVTSRSEAADYRRRIEELEQRSREGLPFPYLKPYLALTVVDELVRLPAVLDLVEGNHRPRYPRMGRRAHRQGAA